MERTLSLVLDDEGKLSLTLMHDDAVKIDEFTSKKFQNSDQIRDYFRKQIDEFLEKNKNYIDIVSKNTGKKFRGRIVVLEARENNNSIEYIEKRVLYKKHLVAFKELVKDKNTMKRFLQLERIGYNERGFRKLISQHLCHEIKYTNYRVVSQTDFLKKELKKDKNNFYDILRIIIKAYEIERKYRKLKTIDALYKDYQNKKKSSQVEQRKTIIDDEMTFQKESLSAKTGIIEDNDKLYIIIDGQYIPIEEAPDIDELNKYDTDFRPDGLGPNERIR